MKLMAAQNEHGGAGGGNNKFDISSRAEIIQIIRYLIKHSELLSVSFNEGTESITTLILELDTEHNRLIFDACGDPAINQKIANSRRVFFSGFHGQVKIEFFSDQPRLGTYQERSAFSSAIPLSLRRFQHREHFRIRIQTGDTYAQWTPPEGEEMRLLVEEVSLGGMSFSLSDPGQTFELYQTLKGCKIDMGKSGMLECDLEVRSLKPTTKKIMDHPIISMGCRFVGLSRIGENVLHRFIVVQERELIQNKRHML